MYNQKEKCEKKSQNKNSEKRIALLFILKKKKLIFKSFLGTQVTSSFQCTCFNASSFPTLNGFRQGRVRKPTGMRPFFCTYLMYKKKKKLKKPLFFFILIFHQIRIDFEDFDIEDPTKSQCKDDSFTADGMRGEICGKVKSGMHSKYFTSYNTI